ncbi:MAG: recombinase family protein [Methylacidiphilales bacterium]|nr:recombinase family protein [Candidatus Methylacidiphilales bacterium]
MSVFAYTYTDLLLETTPKSDIWGEWKVERVYEDLKISSSKTANTRLPKRDTSRYSSGVAMRSQLQKLLTDCQTNPPEYVLVRKLEELGDNLEEVRSRMVELQALGITLVAVEQGYNSSENTLNLRLDFINLIQTIKYQHRSRRIRQAHANNRLAAAPPPGKAPYGYKRGQSKYIIDRTTAPVIKDFFENFLLYGSLRGAVQFLTKKYNKKISVTTGKRWLTNPVYRGDTAYKNGEIISNTHASIITKEEAAQVDRLLRRNSRLPARSASAPRSLAGLVVCHNCQSSMTITHVTTRKKDREYLYLRPINCPKKPKCSAICYQEVFKKTIAIVCSELPQAVAGINSPQIDIAKNNLTDEISRQQQVLELIPELVETGILDAETAKIRAYKLRTEISSLQAQLAILPPVNLSSVAQAVSIPQFWLGLSESEQRFYLREFIRQIEIVRQDEDWELRIVFIF